jgi:hypothetical protein
MHFMKRLSIIIFILLIVVTLQSVYAQAPPPPPPDGGGGDGTVTDVVPINFLIYPLLLLGVIFGYMFTKKSSN